jgi:hypothetical protein
MAVSQIVPKPPSVFNRITVIAIIPPEINKNPCITSSQITASMPPNRVSNTTAIPTTQMTVKVSMPVILESANDSRKKTVPIPEKVANIKAREP